MHLGEIQWFGCGWKTPRTVAGVSQVLRIHTLTMRLHIAMESVQISIMVVISQKHILNVL